MAYLVDFFRIRSLSSVFSLWTNVELEYFLLLVFLLTLKVFLVLYFGGKIFQLLQYFYRVLILSPNILLAGVFEGFLVKGFGELDICNRSNTMVPWEVIFLQVGNLFVFQIFM